MFSCPDPLTSKTHFNFYLDPPFPHSHQPQPPRITLVSENNGRLGQPLWPGAMGGAASNSCSLAGSPCLALFSRAISASWFFAGHTPAACPLPPPNPTQPPPHSLESNPQAFSTY